MYLPEQFIQRMQKQLGDEWEDYLQTFGQNRYYGLRVNPLKVSPQQFKKISPFSLEPIPWCEEGFYYKEDQVPSKHPYYHAGLYYIQEPSAMAPGAILDIQPGDRVLDLCAAPGGKSTQLGARLKNQGVLVSNDVSSTRAKALLKNIELFGIRNAIIISETPENLSKRFEEYFNKILVDAPCSGEGMFRKDPGAIKSWESYGVKHCCQLQRNILKEAAKMLKPGGLLLYSTCTFSPEENEGMIEEFLKNHMDFKIVPIEPAEGFKKAQPQWVGGREQIEGCVRLWPHKIKGEGHFVALLQKQGEESISIFSNKSKQAENKEEEKEKFHEYTLFIKKSIKDPSFLQGNLQMNGNQLLLLPEGIPSLKGLHILRSGWYLGDLKKNRFEPSQAFAMGLLKKNVCQVIDFSIDNPQVIRYLKGETLPVQGESGWNLVCVESYPLGWGKLQNGRLKNKYLPSWRWM